MSFVLAAPDALVAAASDVAGIGSSLSAAGAAAAAPTTGIVAAAEDEISTQIAALFSQHGHGFQQLSAQASAFQERFVQVLSAGAGSYAAAEASAVQTLENAVNAPVAAALGQPLISSGAAAVSSLSAGGSGLGAALSTAVSQVELAVQTGAGLFTRGAQAASALLLAPTGGFGALTTAASALLSPAAATAAAVVPAANALAPIADAIENAYNAIEPWVQYGFQLLEYAAGWVTFLAPQITFFYNLIEPIVQSGLFNILDFVSGQITFAEGLSNFFTATTASINFFIQSEIYWFLGFLPPLPPLPPL
ncbi:PE family protein [Mycobacterium sp. Marseille-P9652]|uniref:PE family protein n=1 Tax=Mycobacterium sp. Marseille-P9652 TaxID=2654950 RepID=UPI0012E85B18|nr:PE family protein [Mycobacterium sp. Marseille-P9652]